MRQTAFLLMAGTLAILPSHARAAGLTPMPVSSESVFVVSDLDRSGSIDLSEFTTYIEKAEGKNQFQADSDFSRMDTNHDNKLSLDELEDGENLHPVATK